MRLVKTPMTLEQYEAKYPHYQTKLMSFSDNEIKEFNDKFHKFNGKNIPNKYALLEKYKWVHIKDRYYQVPRVSKLGKAGIALGGAAAIACAVVLPLTLNNKKSSDLTEEEFRESLMFFVNRDVNRKYSATYKLEDVEEKTNGGGQNSKFEISGVDIKATEFDDKGNTYISYNKIYNQELFYGSLSGEKVNINDVPKSWVRVSDKNLEDDIIYSTFGFTFETYSNNFSKFSKESNLCYKISDFELDMPVLSNGGGSKVKLNAELTFNNDKSLKHLHQTSAEINSNGGSSAHTLEMEFSEIGTCTFDDIKDEVPHQKCVLDDESTQYACRPRSLTKDINTEIEINITSSPIQYIWISCDDEVYQLEDDQVTVKDQGGVTIDKQISKGVIDLKKQYTTSDKKISVSLNLKENIDNENIVIYASSKAPSSNS